MHKDSVEDKVHKVLSNRLKSIHNMFGQIPDTLEDFWIAVAINDEEMIKDRMDKIPEKNPFKLKYEERPGRTKDWSVCEKVLDKDDMMEQLLKGWQA